MHDLKAIRENPDAFKKAMDRRGVKEDDVDRILKIDSLIRGIDAQIQTVQHLRNENAKVLQQIIKIKGADADEIVPLMEQGIESKKEIAQLEKNRKNALAESGSSFNEILLELPNILDDDVPDGADESANKELRAHGEAKPLPFKKNRPADHVEIGEKLGMMDFEISAKLSGARFVLLRDGLAKMERALAAFMLDIHTNEFGYTEILPPSLVKRDIMQGTGQLPKFADDLFHIEKNDLWLIPTAEVSLTNMVADAITDTADLPMRVTAYTPCFRAEAGAAGRDTRGMIRQHQFSKVELVSITTPEDSKAEHERMTNCAEEILKRLGLSYRVMFLCTGDTGFASRRTYDIEVWLPGQNEGQGAFREISSCSNCGDFQARRMKARFRAKGEKDTRFVHTLNGSGLAIGRTMIAVLENYQREDGSVAIPEALQPYMGGMTELTPAKNDG